MNISINLRRLKGFRYPREIIAYAVWAYHRLALSTADVEDLLAARGVIVSREAIRLWVNRFGQHSAKFLSAPPPHQFSVPINSSPRREKSALITGAYSHLRRFSFGPGKVERGRSLRRAQTATETQR